MNQMNTNVDAHLPEWVSNFPLLKDVRDEAWIKTATEAKEVTLPANYEVFHDGDPCENYIFVVDGATRVYKSFENGREMLLYRLQAGETCSLTTSISPVLALSILSIIFTSLSILAARSEMISILLSSWAAR